MRRSATLILVVVLLLLFGIARLPFERKLDASQRSAHLRSAALSLGLREQIGQLSYVAALSGFRSLVAAILWVQAHTAWEQTAWGRMVALFQSVTTLQPRSLIYWDIAAWHMAWNASIAARENPKEPSEFLRMKAEREYHELGRYFLERGIANNPDSYLLHERLGVLLRDKFGDHSASADAFLKAASFPEAPAYVKRMGAYELAKSPGREREAYDALRRIYLMGESERLPSVITDLGELEKKLDIPPADRLIAEQPPEERREPTGGAGDDKPGVEP